MEIKDIPVRCISLKEKGKSRFNNAKSVIHSLGFSNIQKVDAVDGKNLSDDQFKDLLSPRAYHELNYGRYTHQALSGKGSVGCYLSHISTWKECLDTNTVLAVFEDDVNVSSDAQSYLQKAWEKIKDIPNNEWYVFRIVYQNNSDTDREGRQIHPNIVEGAYHQGLNGYIITPKGASELLKEVFPINEHIDYYMGDKLDKLSCSGHYFLTPFINRDLGLESHISHNDLMSYRALDFEWIMWILIVLLGIFWISVTFSH